MRPSLSGSLYGLVVLFIPLLLVGNTHGGHICTTQIHDGLLPKHSKLDSSERTMKALLVTWLAEWAASPLTTTHILRSWNMVFTEVPVTESVDDVDLPCPSAAIPMPAPLLSVVPGHVSDSEEASEAQAEADEASGAEVEDNIDILSVPGTPPVQRAAKRRAETRLDRLAKKFRAAPRDVHAQRVARENGQRAREAREAVQTSDDEGTLSCAVMLTMSERDVSRYECAEQGCGTQRWVYHDHDSGCWRVKEVGICEHNTRSAYMQGTALPLPLPMTLKLQDLLAGNCPQRALALMWEAFRSDALVKKMTAQWITNWSQRRMPAPASTKAALEKWINDLAPETNDGHDPYCFMHTIKEDGSCFFAGLTTPNLIRNAQRGHLNRSYIMSEFCEAGSSATLARAQGHNFKGGDKVLAVEGSECTIKWQKEKKASSHSITDVFLTALHSIPSSDSASEAPLCLES